MMNPDIWRDGATPLVFTENGPLARLVVATFFSRWPVLGKHIDAAFEPAYISSTIGRGTPPARHDDESGALRAGGVAFVERARTPLRHEHEGIEHDGP